MIIKKTIKKSRTIDSRLAEKENAVLAAIMVCTAYAGFIIFVAFVVLSIIKVIPK